MSRLVSKRLLPQSLLEPAPCKLNWIWNRMLFQEKRITDRHAIHILIVYTSNAGSKDCGWRLVPEDLSLENTTLGIKPPVKPSIAAVLDPEMCSKERWTRYADNHQAPRPNVETYSGIWWTRRTVPSIPWVFLRYRNLGMWLAIRNSKEFQSAATYVPVVRIV